MDRKKTILIAVVINAGLLVVLFIAALATQEDVISGGDIVQKTPPAPLFSDAADHALQQQGGSSPIIQLPVASGMPVQDLPKQEASAPVVEAPIVHRLPAPTPDPISSQSPTVNISRAEISFIELTVKKGDSLDKIAKAHHTTVDEIIKLNQLPGSFLKVGQVLKLPKSKSVVQALKPKPIIDKPIAAGPEYYTVKVGDNPWGIAMKHHMKVDELLKLNNLNEERARKLKPGDRLRTR